MGLTAENTIGKNYSPFSFPLEDRYVPKLGIFMLMELPRLKFTGKSEPVAGKRCAYLLVLRQTTVPN